MTHDRGEVDDDREPTHMELTALKTCHHASLYNVKLLVYVVKPKNGF